MEIQPNEHLPREIEKLAEQARSNPTIYKLQLLALALFGDLALTAVQVFPFVLAPLLAAMFFDLAFFYWLTAALAIFLAWVFRPSYRTEGGFVYPEQAPALFAQIESLRQAMDVRYPMQVRIDDSFNASALQTRGLFGLFGTRCVLTIGLPLFIALDQAQLRGVLAHEFGHFSRRHGRLGHWLYRARVGWLSFVNQIGESDSHFDRAAVWYAQRFVPFFARRSFVHSRQCEYEADADAAAAVGSAQFAYALSRVATLGQHWGAVFQGELASLKTELEDAPLDYFERYKESLTRLTDQDLHAFLAAELDEQTNWIDTHPSLTARLAAIGELARAPQTQRSSALDLLGTYAQEVQAKLAAAWVLRTSPDWQLENAWRTTCAASLINVDAQTTAQWSLCKRVERIGALDQLRPVDSLKEASDLLKVFPDEATLKYFSGLGLLREHDKGAAAFLETAARAHPALRFEIFDAVSSYYVRLNDEVQAARWGAWAEAAAPVFARAAAAAVSKFLDGQARVCDLDPRWVACFEKMVHAQSQPVTRMWIGEVPVALRYSVEREPLQVDAKVLALEIDPVQLVNTKQDEENIAVRYVEYARRMFGADAIVAAHTFFSTETQPAACADSLRIARREAKSQVPSAA